MKTSCSPIRNVLLAAVVVLGVRKAASVIQFDSGGEEESTASPWTAPGMPGLPEPLSQNEGFMIGCQLNYLTLRREAQAALAGTGPKP